MTLAPAPIKRRISVVRGLRALGAQLGGRPGPEPKPGILHQLSRPQPHQNRDGLVTRRWAGRINQKVGMEQPHRDMRRGSLLSWCHTACHELFDPTAQPHTAQEP